ncbi:MAG: glycosyl hydrolase family 2 [Bacteroidales bacterium]|nr:glycosyl hydrolase family 2 [Candidatus Cryptobacteroides equifaecalis]
MRRVLLSIMAALLCVSSCGDRNKSPEWYTPQRENRPFIRWWWLGSAVDRQGLDYNLEQFAAKGLGGVEITPLYGVQGNEANDIDYLSPKWMEMLAYTCGKASDLGLQVDMSNCTGWPFGGPWITDQDAAKTFRFNADTTEVIPVGTGQKVKRAAPGGEGLVMDHYSLAALQHYLAPFDTAFAASGCPFPDTFFNDSFEVYDAGWTPALPEAFFKDHGYRIEDHLKAFARNDGSPEAEQVIADYRATLSRLYMEEFVLPWRDWVHGHGARNRHQAHGAPANLVDVYAAADIPECEAFGQSPFDIRGLHRTGDTRLNDADPAVFKFASSAAHVTGKKYTSCETLTWLTEHFHTSLALCKPEIDLALASGVNHVYLHGAPYSPEGLPFPAWKFYATINLSPANPSIWEVADPLFGYITRCQAFLSAGESDADFLMYFPVEDIWHHHFQKQFMMLDIHKMHLTMPQFKEDVLSVLRSGHDVDYISDALLEGVRVRRGELVTAAGTRYRALVLPSETAHMPLATREKLNSLRSGGAKILTMEEIAGCGVVPEPAMALPGIHMLRRRNGQGGKNYFIANLGPDDLHEITLACDSRAVSIFDPMTGESGMAQILSRGPQTVTLRLDLRSGESVLLKTFARRQGGYREWSYFREAGESVDLSGQKWELEFLRSAPAMPQTKYALDSLCSWTELPGGSVNEAVGVYRTTVDIAQPADDWVLTLGDVRESAVVKVNGRQAGTLIAAPFSIRIGEFLHPGENVVEIEVRNLPANRIAQMDREGKVWRIFKDVNIAAVKSRQVVTYEQIDSYAWWPVVPSGLCPPVLLTPVMKN